MESEEEIRTELETVDDFSQVLPTKALYIAGALKSKTSLSPNIILTFLHKVYSDFKTGKVPEDAKAKIEIALYKGDLGNAKTLLENALFNSLFIPQEILQPAVQNKPETAFYCAKCKYAILDDDCIVLESCTHTFHLKCLTQYLNENITKNTIKISCPSCHVEIQPGFFQQYIDKNLMRYYENLAFERLIKSGEIGRIIKCPNYSCTAQFEIQDQTTLECPECHRNICGKCEKVQSDCQCNKYNNFFSKLQCPFCKRRCKINRRKGPYICKGCDMCRRCRKVVYNCQCRA
ncbi:unnamed protein product [Blepharisma stoltei]|uniref:Anaphase-promoting complex subunit 11 n=1 Tax=Blepharisma stoltei TaxID=1481888 RepID=A0AAU9JZK3_9CILI|nr:unnamed protein product [Blepharisma stoltei]